MDNPGWAIPIAFGLAGFIYSAIRQLTRYDPDTPSLTASIAGALATSVLLAILLL